MSELLVTTHVGRDLLQSASVFKTADVAVWEYIVNSLQYVDPGTSPKVIVDIENHYKRITITDNGLGMDEKALAHFFTMHGENIERKVGVGGRGKYGTGKSAALGIGKKLIVDTVKNGVRNRIELSRSEIEASDGNEIPLNRAVINEKAKNIENGTKIIIENIFVPKIDVVKIIKKVEKHLQSFRHANPEVLVGDHVCAIRNPVSTEEYVFKSEGEVQRVLGECELIVRVASAPLDAEDRRIAVSCGPGNLLAVEDAGVCSKDCGEYLFGEVDVPNLESDKYEMDPIDSSRDMILRPEHPVVIMLISFIGSKMDEVRKIIVKRRKEAMKDSQNKHLEEHAHKIADLLNRDFSEVNDRIMKIRASQQNKGAVPTDIGADTGEVGEPLDWIKGTMESGVVDEVDTAYGDGEVDEISSEETHVVLSGHPDSEGSDRVDPISPSTTSTRKRKPKGGFSVEYENMGEEEVRATYFAEKGVFIINLDHAVVKSALSSLGIDDIGFIRLSYEIVFAEYALALADMSIRDDPDIPADEAIFDAREILNRVSARSAVLYQS